MSTSSEILLDSPLRNRLLAAVDMMEFGIGLMRQNLVRRYPDATEEEINCKLQCWLFEPDRGVRTVKDSDTILA